MDRIDIAIQVSIGMSLFCLLIAFVLFAIFAQSVKKNQPDWRYSILAVCYFVLSIAYASMKFFIQKLGEL